MCRLRVVQGSLSRAWICLGFELSPPSDIPFSVSILARKLLATGFTMLRGDSAYGMPREKGRGHYVSTVTIGSIPRPRQADAPPRRFRRAQRFFLHGGRRRGLDGLLNVWSNGRSAMQRDPLFFGWV